MSEAGKTTGASLEGRRRRPLSVSLWPQRFGPGGKEAVRPCWVATALTIINSPVQPEDPHPGGPCTQRRRLCWSARQPHDEAAWRRLVALYTPLLLSWARRHGVSEHDAADLVQEVFVALIQTLPTFQYDRRRGQFRNWLRTLLLNKLRDRKRRTAREEKALEQLVAEAEAADGATAFWEDVYRQELYRRALQLLQNDFAPATWKAFWETVVQGRPAADVARELETTENAIYAGRFRILRRLRHELTGLIE